MELNNNCGTYFEDPLNSYLPRPQDPKCKRTFLGGKTDIINKLIWRSESDCYIADWERFSSLQTKSFYYYYLYVYFGPYFGQTVKLANNHETFITEVQRL